MSSLRRGGSSDPPEIWLDAGLFEARLTKQDLGSTFALEPGLNGLLHRGTYVAPRSRLMSSGGASDGLSTSSPAHTTPGPHGGFGRLALQWRPRSGTGAA